MSFDIWVKRFLKRSLLQITPAIFLIAIALLLPGCRVFNFNTPAEILAPSNDRPWTPDQVKLPFAESSVTDNDNIVHLHNIRNCRYLSEDDYIVEHYNRSFPIGNVTGVDFIVVPFRRAPALAHTMLSFAINDGTRIAVSVETRKERGEKFGPARGLLRQFELMYVFGDERDLIRLRTDHHQNEVYVYPTVASAQQAQDLLVGILDRANRLASQPEFYHSITNNCTTNLVEHVNQISPGKIRYNWRVLLPGFSAQYAYDLGLLDNTIPLEDLAAAAFVNDRAKIPFNDPDFSIKIREGRNQLARYRELEVGRRDIIRGRADEYLSRREAEQYR